MVSGDCAIRTVAHTRPYTYTHILIYVCMHSAYIHGTIKNYIKSIAKIIFKLMLRNNTDMLQQYLLKEVFQNRYHIPFIFDYNTTIRAAFVRLNSCDKDTSIL